MRWTIGRNASIAPISAGATPISTPPTMPLVCGIGSAIEDDHGGSDKTAGIAGRRLRSEEHTSELQSLMRISYAVFCLKKKKIYPQKQTHQKHKETIHKKSKQ